MYWLLISFGFLFALLIGHGKIVLSFLICLIYAMVFLLALVFSFHHYDEASYVYKENIFSYIKLHIKYIWDFLPKIYLIILDADLVGGLLVMLCWERILDKCDNFNCLNGISYYVLANFWNLGMPFHICNSLNLFPNGSVLSVCDFR